MSELDVEVARWLVADVGLAAVAAATQLLDDGSDELRVVTALRARITDPARTAAAIGSAVARRRARDRWLEADRLLFTRESLEQASDPSVAAWRARRFRDAAVYDLCSGVGGDATAIARNASTVTAVDLDEARLVLLRHNADVFGLHIPTVLGDATTIEVPPDHLVHVDPARRRGGHRIGEPTRTLPPVDALVAAHARLPGLAVVLAPGTDAEHPALGSNVEVEYLQLGGDLVEAVAWSGVLRDDDVTASATILPRPSRPRDGADHARSASLAPGNVTLEGVTPMHRVRRGPRGPRLQIGEVGDHLVEVAAAAIRARLHDEIGSDIGAHRLSRHRALLTVDEPPPASAWYRVRQVVQVLPARPAPIRRWLAAADRGPMELVLHGVGADPTRWWRELGRPERGPNGIRIELVRRDQDAIAIITREPVPG